MQNESAYIVLWQFFFFLPFLPLKVLLWQCNLDGGPAVPLGKVPADHTCAGSGKYSSQNKKKKKKHICWEPPIKSALGLQFHHTEPISWSRNRNVPADEMICYKYTSTHTLTSTGKTWHRIFFVALLLSHPSFFSLSNPSSFLSSNESADLITGRLEELEVSVLVFVSVSVCVCSWSAHVCMHLNLSDYAYVKLWIHIHGNHSWQSSLNNN